MNKTILVADSGGTQTDWCYVDELGRRTSFTTKSFHPSYWNEEFFQEFDLFWKEKSEMKKANLHFYGTGCLNESNQILMMKYFSRWGFQNCKVESDVLGACHALLGNEKGNVAILGTGSVLCQYDGKKIISIHGGLGYLLGDEGSGYYFGKMLLSNLLNDQFDPKTSEKLFELLGNKKEVLSKVYGPEGKLFISSISRLTFNLESIRSAVNKLHEMNLELFLNTCLLSFYNGESGVSVVGSYGYFQRDIFMEILHKNNYHLIKVLQYPIDSLTDYIEKRSF